MQKIVINQYTPSITVADGVSNSLFLIDKMLKELGFLSNIYAEQIDKKLKNRVKHISKYIPSNRQLLLYHYSIYDQQHNKIINFEDKKVLIYHNITPHFYFKKDSMLQTICKDAREQLKNKAKYFIASISDSDYNAQELKYYGFKNIQTIPLLIDLNKNQIPNKSIINKYKNNYNILFVGRLVPNKAQHQLIDLVYLLKQEFSNLNFKLHLIGKISDKEYYQYLKEHINNLSLQNCVNITQKIDDNDLAAYYKLSDIFISLSEHEGFCIPLIESMNFDTITIGYNTTAINTTLPKTSLFNYKTPTKVTKLIKDILSSSTLKENIISNQRKHLKQFSYNNLKTKLANFLSTLNLNINYKEKNQNINNPKTIQIEGPFDSSYSLAIVNLNLAKSLNKYIDTKLYSTEGYGDFKPSKSFLLQDKEAKSLYSKPNITPNITIRNTYPPRTNAMQGIIRAIGPYGWEESAFLYKHIELFNTRLTHLFTMSSYVKDVMITNGITTPITNTGIGVTHILNYKAKPFKHKQLNGIKLLHISSCFPRKGVDILLKAFKELKEEGLNLSLIIKTFPNPHSNIKELISSLPQSIKNNILLIEEELSANNINYLYQYADILVAPSKGEGFGLPMAEAMLFELPVITTAYGGQMDFCNKDRCWLIDYNFAKAKTHFKLFNSIWVEPKKDSLKEQIKILYNLPPEKIIQKTILAKNYIRDNYNWDNIAKNILSSLNEPQKVKSNNKLAIISSYNTKCGIAQYIKNLIQYFKTKDITILSNYSSTLLNEQDEKNVIRCWGDRFDKDINTLLQELKPFTHILIEFNFSFISINNLKALININKDKQITLQLHSVKDVTIKGLEASLSKIKDELNSIHRLIVHNIEDLNILKSFNITKNLTYLPLGVKNFKPNTSKQFKLKNRYNLPSKRIISTYGFLLPHKGILELISAFNQVNKIIPNTHLLLLTSIYPISISNDYLTKVQILIKKLNLQPKVTLITTFLDIDDILNILSLSQLIVLPYKQTQESSSAAAKDALSTKKPILCTKLSIFEDIEDVVYFSNNNLAIDIIEFLKKDTHSKAKLQEEWIKVNNFKNIAKRLENSIYN